MLQIDELTVYQDKQKIIDSLSLQLAKSEILAIFGESGSGKTTLLRAIAGLHPISQGCVHLEDECLSKDNFCHVLPEARGIGMVFQDYALFPHLSVAENITFGLWRLSSAEKKQTVERLLSLIKLPNIGKRFPHQLSGGEQQRVALARTLAMKPKLLLLDEPFSNLDCKHVDNLVYQLKEIISECQLMTILVSHEIGAAGALADHIHHLESGNFVRYPHQVAV